MRDATRLGTLREGRRPGRRRAPPLGGAAVAALAVGVAAAVTGCASAPEPEPPEVDRSRDCTPEPGTEDEPILLIAGDVPCGAIVFVDHCTECHGPAGEGTDDGPDLAAHVPFHTDLGLAALLANGGDDMPDPELTNHQAADVLAWLRDEFGAYEGDEH